MDEPSSTTNRRKCVVCSIALPENSTKKVCSSGCGLIYLIPRNPNGPLPASWSLALVVGSFVVLFNQLLVASMAWIKAGSDPVENAGRFAIASLVIGVIWVIVEIFILVKIKVFQRMDGVILALSLAVIFYPWAGDLLGIQEFGFTYQFAVGNLIFGAWMGRNLGLLRA